MYFRSTSCLILVLLGLRAALSWSQAKLEPPYALERSVRLGGVGGWDYFEVDQAKHRVFIPRGSHLMVTSEKGAVLADIPNLPGAHAVAIAQDLNRAFTANDSGHSVTVFALDTLKTIAEIKIGSRTPDGILYDPFSKRVFTFNGGTDHNATIIDADSAKVVGELALNGKPETAQSDGAGKVFVNIQDHDQIQVIEAKTGHILSTWSTAPCKEPAGMAIDTTSKHLFLGCRNLHLTVVDYSSGKTSSSVPIGWLVDADRFDPSTGLIFSSAADGSLTIARLANKSSLEVVQMLRTPLWARTIAYDNATHRLFAITADVRSGPYPPGAAHPQRQGPIRPGSFKLLIYSQRSR